MRYGLIIALCGRWLDEAADSSVSLEDLMICVACWKFNQFLAESEPTPEEDTPVLFSSRMWAQGSFILYKGSRLHYVDQHVHPVAYPTPCPPTCGKKRKIPGQKHRVKSECHACIARRALEAQTSSALGADILVFVHKLKRGDCTLDDWPGTAEQFMDFMADLVEASEGGLADLDGLDVDEPDVDEPDVDDEADYDAGGADNDDGIIGMVPYL